EFGDVAQRHILGAEGLAGSKRTGDLLNLPHRACRGGGGEAGHEPLAGGGDRRLEGDGQAGDAKLQVADTLVLEGREADGEGAGVDLAGDGIVEHARELRQRLAGLRLISELRD